MNQLTKIEKPAALPEERAAAVEKTFLPMLAKAKELENRFNQVLKMGETPEAAAAARALRLEYKAIRLQVEKERKAQKEAYLQAGRFVDAVAKVYTATAGDKEEKLKEVEEYEKRREEARRAEVQAKREKELSKYLDPEEIPGKLGELSPDVYRHYLQGVKKNYEAMKAAERKAEEERKAREEAERVERERLEKQAKEEKEKREALEKKMKEEEAKRKKAEAARREKERKEREALEAKRKAEEAARLKAEEEARKLKEAEAARIKAEEEKKAREEAARLAAIEAEKKKGDKEKAKDFAKCLREMAEGIPEFKSKDYQTRAEEVAEMLYNLAKLLTV